MVRADANLKKTAKVPGYMWDSSDSELETGSNSSKLQIFRSVIDEYLGTGAKKSAWHRIILQGKGDKCFEYLVLSQFNLNLNCSDCRAAKIIANDTELESILSGTNQRKYYY